MLQSVALVRTDVCQEHIVSIIKVTKTGELGTTLSKLATEASCAEILCRYKEFHLL
jgi:hypothetical protein